jgi:protein TonB
MADVREMNLKRCHRFFGCGYVLAAIVISALLHVGAVYWWFAVSRQPLQPFQDAGVQAVTVDLITPSAPESAFPQASPVESDQLEPDDMAEQMVVTRKPLPEKKRLAKKAVEKILSPVPAVAQSAPAVASSPAPAPAPVQISAARYDADYLNNPAPTYPSLSRRLGEEGRVILRVQVSAEGKPLRVELKQSSGFERLDNAAIKAAEAWRFVPARQAGIPVTSGVEVPLQFSLKK